MPDLTLDLARRLAAASEVLSQLAQRDGRVAEIMRLREALERIVEEGEALPYRRISRAVAIAKEALRHA